MSEVESPTNPPIIVTDPATELRTFVFADIRGYTRFTEENGDQAAAALVSKFGGLIQAVAAARGGRVVELRGDEALIVFGSARQALRSSVDMQKRFAHETQVDPLLPLRVGIGMDAGEAIPVGTGYRGEVLNLAARLCNLAGPGEVLASEGVIYLGRRVQGMTFAERGLVQLKGFADPIRVIRVLGRDQEAPPEQSYLDHAPMRSDSPLPIGGFLGALPAGVLVGRDDEWKKIIASLENVHGGAGKFVMLAGEPGVGKTRLAQELTLKARHWNFMVGTGRCYQQEMAVPFYPFIEALTSLYNVASPLARAEIPLRWPQLQRLLPDVVGPFMEPATEPRDDQQQLLRAVTGFLQMLAESMPVALLLDDLHWADDSTLKLLQHLARYTHGDRVLLLGTYRDVEVNRLHPLETFLMDLGRESLVESIEIRRLDQQGTSDLLGEILGHEADLADLAQLVHRRTEGNAFFTQEVVRALVERGDVYRRNGRWERRPDLEMDVPKSIRSAIGQRLSRLGDDSQEILRKASVLGQVFYFDDLLALSNEIEGPADHHQGPDTRPWTEDEVEASLQEAETAGLVRETDGDRYAFYHSLTHQALFSELSTRRKKRLHLAAGRVLERLPERVRIRRAAEIAWHFLEGDHSARALPYAMLAGDRAEEVFAHGEAETHYRTVLELSQELGDVSTQAMASEKLAAVLSLVTRYDESLDYLERAIDIHRSSGNIEAEACAAAQLGHVHYLRGSRSQGMERLQPIIERVEKEQAGREPTYGLAALYAALARLHCEAHHSSKTLALAERSSALAATVGDDHLLIGAEVTRGDALWRVGREDEAISVLERIIPRAEAASDLANLTRALGNAAAYYGRRGEFAKDRIYHERMLEVAERRGDRGYIVLAAMALSANAFLVGDWPRSREFLDRAENMIQSLGARRLSLWPLAARAWLSLREGDLDVAQEQSSRTIDVAQTLDDANYLRLANRVLAVRDMMEGHGQEAFTRLEPFLSERDGTSDYGLLRDLGTACLMLGRIEEAGDFAQRSIALATADKDQPELVESLILRGAVFQESDQLSASEESFESAAVAARRLPFPYGQAQALTLWAKTHIRQGDGDRAKSALAQALSTFENLGAHWDAERVKSLLEAP